MNQNDVLPHRPLRGLLVDGFRHTATDVSHYILTHFHSDHYGGLDDSFPTGMGAPEDAVIYCTPVTAGLVEHVLGVSRKFLRLTPFDSTVVLSLPGGSSVELTFIPANHCPGSAMLLLKTADQAILHTGDCRYCPAMLQSPALQPWVRSGNGAGRGSSASASASASSSLSASASAAASRPAAALPLDLFLDTTYAHPKHVFLPQEESLRLGVSIVAQFMPRKDVTQSLLLLEGGVSESEHGGASAAASGGGATRAAAGAGAASSITCGFAIVEDSAYCDGAAGGADGAEEGVDDGPDDGTAGSGYGAAAAAMMFPSAPPPPTAGRAASSSAGRAAAAEAMATPGQRDAGVEGEDDSESAAAAAAASLPSGTSPASAPRIALLAPLEPPVPPAHTDRTLVIVSTYVIGKERLLLELARRLHLRIFVSERKLQLVRLLGLSASDAGWFTCCKRDADVHVAGMDACGKHFPYFAPDFARMRRYCAAVNRLHALAELGLLPAAATAGAGAGAATRPGATSSAVGSSSLGMGSAAATVDASAGACATAVLCSPAFDAASGVEEDDDDETEAAARRARRAAAAAAISSAAASRADSSAAGSAAAAPRASAGAAGSVSSGSTAGHGHGGYAYGRFMPQPPAVEARIAALPPRYTRVIGLLPTGWVHSNKKKAYMSPGAGAVADAGATAAGTPDGAACDATETAEAAVGPAAGGAGARKPTSASSSSSTPAALASSSSSAASAHASTGSDSGAIGAELAAEVHLIPYSEHSSFAELTTFVKALRPRKLVPTVYSDAADRDRIVARFSSLLDTTAAKRDFLKAFGASSPAAAAAAAVAPVASRSATGKAGSSNGAASVKDDAGAGRSSSATLSPTTKLHPEGPSDSGAASSADDQHLVSRSGSRPVGSCSTVVSSDISSSFVKRARLDAGVIELDDDGDVVQAPPVASSAAKSVIGTKSANGKTKARGAPHAAAGDITRFFSRA